MAKWGRYIIWVWIGFWSACSTDPIVPTEFGIPQEIAVPAAFPPVPQRADNRLTDRRIALGEKLFFDPILSRNQTVSCGTCHLPEKAFADNQPISIGIEGRVGFRNVPSLGNIVYHPYFFREGGSPKLHLQVFGPIEEEVEMDFNMVKAVERLRTDTTYQALAMQAYGRQVDAFVITRAIAAFESTLITGNSRFDQYFYQEKENVLSEEERLGLALFFSERTQCSSCHSDFNFTNYAFENIGLYGKYIDKGRQRITRADGDIGKFKVPSLRNAALTYPYMHDGSLATLEAVIEHYDKGGIKHPNQSKKIKPLHLSQEEKAALVAFLGTLTDESFVGKN